MAAGSTSPGLAARTRAFPNAIFTPAGRAEPSPEPEPEPEEGHKLHLHSFTGGEHPSPLAVKFTGMTFQP